MMPSYLRALAIFLPSAWVSKKSESIAACSAGTADAWHRWLKNVSSKWTQLKLGKQTSSNNLTIKQKDSCSFFPSEVPIITVLCFQHLPEFSVKIIFLEPSLSQDLHLRVGLECNVSKRYHAVFKVWHRGRVIETAYEPDPSTPPPWF